MSLLYETTNLSDIAVEEKDGVVTVNLALLRQAPDKIKSTAATEEAELRAKIIERDGSISNVTAETKTTQKYKGRKNYKDIFNRFQENTIDTWYKSPLYGRINDIGMIASLDIDVGTPLFIRQALGNIKRQFKRRYLKKTSRFLPEIQIVRGYENPNLVISSYLNDFYDELFSTTLFRHTNSARIKNIGDFYFFVKQYAELSGRTLTTPGFMEGGSNNPFTTGLVYEVYDGDPNDDIVKQEFYNDPNFGVYSYVLKMNGFKIDPNIPWRIIADLNSDRMWDYLVQYEFPEFTGQKFETVNLNDVYSKIFVPHANYFNFALKEESFVKSVIFFYNRFIGEYPTFSINHSVNAAPERRVRVPVDKSVWQPGEDYYEIVLKSAPRAGVTAGTTKPEKRIITEVVKREEYEDQEPYSAQWMKWYAEMRVVERQSRINKTDFSSLVREISQIYSLAIQKFQAGDEDKFEYLTNAAINYVEYVLGTIGAVQTTIDKNNLTIIKEDPILLLKALEEI
tara:strand:+ start:143 stop:1672 length:1530 start_codon:yes stop_codon:yes gene_type:complete